MLTEKWSFPGLPIPKFTRGDPPPKLAFGFGTRITIFTPLLERLKVEHSEIFLQRSCKHSCWYCVYICYFQFAQTNRKRKYALLNWPLPQLFIYNAIGNAALTNSRETKCFQVFVQYQKYQIIGLEYVEFVLSMFFNFGQFLALRSCQKKVLDLHKKKSVD